MTAEEFEALQKSGAEIEVLPMKVVAIKPEKYNGRVLVCGNMTQMRAHDTSVGGAYGGCYRGISTRLAHWTIET